MYFSLFSEYCGNIIFRENIFNENFSDENYLNNFWKYLTRESKDEKDS